MDFSLIVPCYNEAENLSVFFGSACRCFENTDYSCELIFVNDGSNDGTTDVILQQIDRYRSEGGTKLSFSMIELSRNFGKESALFAGLDHASGDYIGFIDTDMQQDPQVALTMLQILINEPEFDCVAAVQKKRRESLGIRLFKRCFYRIFNVMSSTQLLADVSDFRVFTRQVADAILSMHENYRFSKGLFSWVGFRTKVIPYEVHERYAGKTKWSFRKLLSYGWNGVLAFSTLPLKIIMVLGIVLALCSVVLFLFDVYQKIAFNDEIPLSMILLYVVVLLSGIQMAVLGVLGEYMARGYIEAKQRPVYIARTEYVDRATSSEEHKRAEEDSGQSGGVSEQEVAEARSRISVYPGKFEREHSFSAHTHTRKVAVHD